MSPDEGWVREKLEEIERKRAVLAALRESLETWERDVDWEGLPPSKQAALMALAEESVATLQSMIARLREDINTGLGDLNSAGTAPPRKGDPA
jgi:hypothetical protein